MSTKQADPKAIFRQLSSTQRDSLYGIGRYDSEFVYAQQRTMDVLERLGLVVDPQYTQGDPAHNYVCTCYARPTELGRKVAAFLAR